MSGVETRRKALDLAAAVGMAGDVDDLLGDAVRIERYINTGETHDVETHDVELDEGAVNKPLGGARPYDGETPAFDLTVPTLAEIFQLPLAAASEIGCTRLQSGRWQAGRRAHNRMTYRVPKYDVPADRLHLVPDSARGVTL